VAGEGEHGPDDERPGRVESKRHAGEDPDLGVRGLDEPVGEVVLDRGEDPVAAFHDALLQLHERGHPAAPRPADPPVQRVSGCLIGELEDHASALFQQTLWKNSENLTENQHVTGRRGIGAGRCAHSRRVISA
jgi:hypothetical protein